MLHFLELVASSLVFSILTNCKYQVLSRSQPAEAEPLLIVTDLSDCFAHQMINECLIICDFVQCFHSCRLMIAARALLHGLSLSMPS